MDVELVGVMRMAVIVLLALLSSCKREESAAAQPVIQPMEKKVASKEKPKEGVPALEPVDPYDPKSDPEDLFAEAVAAAAKDHRPILLMFGASWCGWCKKLDALLTSDEAIKKALRRYHFVHINADHENAAALGDRFGGLPGSIPLFVVVDETGKRSFMQGTGPLENGDEHDPKKVLAFLEHATEKLPAAKDY